MLKVSREDFAAQKYRRFGRHNPEIMNCPFWDYMIKNGSSAWEARQQFGQQGERFTEALWCFDRFGISETRLPDGRYIKIGGEHEDVYDDDFSIYNDVIVFTNDVDFTIYGYSKEVFPPTDFHSATLVDKNIYIIGGLGYREERDYVETPVYRLDTLSYEIHSLTTHGEKPGWIHNHEAIYLEQEKMIYLSGGLLSLMRDEREILAANIDDYVLDLAINEWSKVTDSTVHRKL